jgi:hypothetical protein
MAKTLNAALRRWMKVTPKMYNQGYRRVRSNKEAAIGAMKASGHRNFARLGANSAMMAATKNTKVE